MCSFYRSKLANKAVSSPVSRQVSDIQTFFSLTFNYDMNWPVVGRESYRNFYSLYGYLININVSVVIIDLSDYILVSVPDR